MTLDRQARTFTKFSLSEYDLEKLYKQVVAPKGLDISHPTTVIMPNHVGFAQLFSQRRESVAKALWDSNRQDYFSKKSENKQIASLCNEY